MNSSSHQTTHSRHTDTYRHIHQQVPYISDAALAPGSSCLSLFYFRHARLDPRPRTDTDRHIHLQGSRHHRLPFALLASFFPSHRIWPLRAPSKLAHTHDQQNREEQISACLAASSFIIYSVLYFYFPLSLSLSLPLSFLPVYLPSSPPPAPTSAAAADSL